MAHVTYFIHDAVYIQVRKERGGVQSEWFIVAEPLVIEDKNISQRSKYYVSPHYSGKKKQTRFLVKVASQPEVQL